MTTKTWTRLTRVAAAAGLSLAIGASAQAAPDSFAYVGQLTDSMGPVDDTLTTVSVKLWDAATGGNDLWTQSWSDVEVVGGLFRIQVGMGATPALGPVLLDRDAVWLGIAVNGQAPATRQKLTTTGYAQMARHAQNLDGIAADDYLTKVDLAATPSRAGTAATAPTNPGPGQLWYDESEQVLYTWDDADMEWEAITIGDLEPSNLPPNGLEAVSNGVLSNEFTNVSHLWTTGADIADAGVAGPGAVTLAEIQVNEDAGSYMYGIQINTNLSLTSGNDITMTLYPPNGTLVDPIVLLDGVFTFGPYANVWTTATMPALEELLYTNPSGTWTLAMVDNDDNLDNGGTNVAGTLNSLEIRYDIVRSDNVQAQGLFEADDIVATNVWANEVQVSGGMVGGNLRTTGALIRNVQAKIFSNSTTPNNAKIADREINFTKRRDDTVLFITWHDVAQENTTSNVVLRMYINDDNDSPDQGDQWCRNWKNNELRWRMDTGSGNWYNDRSITRHGFCESANNIGDGTYIPAGSYTLSAHSSVSANFGQSGSMGSITIEEVFVD